MAGFTLVRSTAEWMAYTRAFAAEHQLPGDQINWGAGPQQFPALVASLFLDFKIRSCYVYLEDAVNLVAACGLRVVEPGVAEGLAPGSPPRSEHDKYMAANILALVRTLVEIRATTQERYEQDLAVALAQVDQYHEEDKAQVLAKLLAQPKSEAA